MLRFIYPCPDLYIYDYSNQHTQQRHKTPINYYRTKIIISKLRFISILVQICKSGCGFINMDMDI